MVYVLTEKNLELFASFSAYRAACKIELEETISKKRFQYAMTYRQRRNIERGLDVKNFPASSWRPKGTLIAHLHEHEVCRKIVIGKKKGEKINSCLFLKGGISKLVRIPEKPIFASAATDGCVRVSMS